MENIRREVRELRVILESVEAKKHERVWLKNQSSGDLDDTKMYVSIFLKYKNYNGVILISFLPPLIK